MTAKNNRKDNSMYELYESYKETLKNSRKTLRKRQKINAEIREKYDSPFSRDDHILNTRDITYWNQMISELETDMREIEMYLDFEDRELLHRDYNNMKSMILNQNSYEGEIPLETLYGESVPDIADMICDVELQEEIVELLTNVLTQRQKQIINLYYFEGMTQERIARELGLDRTTITKIVQNSLEILRKCDKIAKIIEK